MERDPVSYLQIEFPKMLMGRRFYQSDSRKAKQVQHQYLLLPVRLCPLKLE